MRNKKILTLSLILVILTSLISEIVISVKPSSLIPEGDYEEGRVSIQGGGSRPCDEDPECPVPKKPKSPRPKIPTIVKPPTLRDDIEQVIVAGAKGGKEGLINVHASVEGAFEGIAILHAKAAKGLGSFALEMHGLGRALNHMITGNPNTAGAAKKWEGRGIALGGAADDFLNDDPWGRTKGGAKKVWTATTLFLRSWEQAMAYRKPKEASRSAGKGAGTTAYIVGQMYRAKGRGPRKSKCCPPSKGKASLKTGTGEPYYPRVGDKTVVNQPLPGTADTGAALSLPPGPRVIGPIKGSEVPGAVAGGGSVGIYPEGNLGNMMRLLDEITKAAAKK